MTDLDARIARLRRKLAAADDPDDRADLEAAIAALEAQRPVEHTITVQDQAQVGVAVAGDVHGHIYLDGRRGKTATQLLHNYLGHLTHRCGLLPLQGVYEQRTTVDNLDIHLDRVYTQLATTSLVEREQVAGAALAEFDVKTYLDQHTGRIRLPAQHRTGIRVRRRHGEDDPTATRGDVPVSLGAEAPPDLERMDAETLTRAAQEAESLTFVGPQLVSEAIAAHPRLVLLGEPGSGKSTALRYLALTLAIAGLDETIDLTARLEGWSLGRVLPVFASLLPLAKRLAATPERAGDAGDLWNYLADHLEPKGANPGLAAAVHEEIEAGRALLLLDGLDEVAGSDSRGKVVRAVGAFADEHPRCRIVVACRVRAYEGERNRAWQLPGWPTATLADWTVGQMMTFVRAWYHAVAELRGRSDGWRDERIAGLTQAIEKREDLRRFGRQPLMITIMALVHLNDGRLPEERARLYSRCIDILLGQWEIVGKEQGDYGTLMSFVGLPDTDVQSLRPLLGRAAYEAHRAAGPDEVGRLSRAVLRTMVDDELKRRGHPNPSAGAERFLEYTDERAGLIQANDAGDDYSFPHQTFQEYLAGVELVGGVDPVARIMGVRGDDRWRRPILLGIEQLALGSLAIPHHLLTCLVEEAGRDARQRAFDLLLAAEIADDMGWAWLEQRSAIFTGLRARLAAGLAEMVGETAVPTRDRVLAGRVIGLLGDPRDGVCKLPPALVELSSRDFVIGIQSDEVGAVREQWLTYWREQGKVEEAERYADYFTTGETNAAAAALHLPAFAIARYPVTNAQFKLFMDDGGYDPAQPWWDEAARAWLARDDAATEGLERWQRRTHKEQPEWWDNSKFGIARPNHPVVGVSWYEARAFCDWLTRNRKYNPEGYVYTLPSEAEWEYAARGTERRLFPWGPEDPDGERANCNQIYKGTTAVGCFLGGATPQGTLDMAGNVWEWTRSVYAPYPYNPEDGREETTDPARKRFTLRGGGWYDRPIYLRASDRDNDTPVNHSDDVGFRLARHPPV